MGARLVGAALSPAWAHLHDKPMRVLVYMCLRARDTPTADTRAGEFWGGHEELARMLNGHDDITGADLRVIKRCMSELRKSGAVSVIARAYPGHCPRYRLDVERGHPLPVDNHPVDTSQEPPEQPEWGPETGPLQGPESGPHRGPISGPRRGPESGPPQETTSETVRETLRPNNRLRNHSPARATCG